MTVDLSQGLLTDPLNSYNVYCGAAHFAASCGLHRIKDTKHHSIMQILPPAYQSLLPPPATGLELGERIVAFWTIYNLDKLYTVVGGFASALPSKDDPIETVLPLDIRQYEMASPRVN